MDVNDFWRLCAAPLHEFGSPQWNEYDPAMAQWLRYPDAQIRKQAVERLATAVFRERRPAQFAQQQPPSHYLQRTKWLLNEIDEAGNTHSDMPAEFLRVVRHRNPQEHQLSSVLIWLNKLENAQPYEVDPNLVKGAQIMLHHPETDWPTQASKWIALLDHSSDWVRGCAAYRLGSSCDEQNSPTEAELFALIGAKEVERPGIAGCFWADRNDGPYSQAEAFWMLNLLEQRKGPAPAQGDTPFNDIEFHLHEIFAFSPDIVKRMIKGGYVALALMTATEILQPVQGMRPMLQKLARHTDPAISGAASRHLDQYYSDA